MVLTPEFWINYSKNYNDEQFLDKIVREDIYIVINKLEKTYPSISCCSYNGRDFNSFYNNLITTIKNHVQQLNIKQILGLEWFIRPNDKPKNLAELLIGKGYEKIRSDYKMGIDLETYEKDIIIKNFEFDVKKVEQEKMLEEPILKLMLANFPTQFLDSEDVKKKWSQMVQLEEKRGNTIENFIVYTKSEHKQVALASLLIRNDLQNIAYLNGAVTESNYRHKGIYTVLLFKRIQRCKELGLRYITIDANQSTSGPILKKQGFKIFDEIDTYRLKFNHDTNI